MQLIDGQPVFSATDLVGYLACEHLTALERAALAGLVERPMREDPRARRHPPARVRSTRRATSTELRAEGRTRRRDRTRRRRRPRRPACAARRTETIEAMASGDDVIFQATFFDGRWLGYADFLLRVESPDRPSVWGPYHYEVADTKLARHVKAGAVLQICSYVEQLTRIQGVAARADAGRPRRERARDGDLFASTTTWPTSGPRSAASRVRARTDARRRRPAYPPAADLPGAGRALRRLPLGGVCVQRASRRRPPLARRRHHRAPAQGARRPRARHASRAWRRLPLPFDPPLDGTSAASIERVREQARIQVEGEDWRSRSTSCCCRPPGEPIEPERGLATAPRADRGRPLLRPRGRPVRARRRRRLPLRRARHRRATFTPIWSFDPDDAGRTSRSPARRPRSSGSWTCSSTGSSAIPKMHVYHYAPYEPTALGRLMGRHATREDEVDRLLRGGVLVDLFRAVRQGVRASVESYSIKRIEPLYGFVREIGLRDAGSSIVAFEEWLELGDGRPADVRHPRRDRALQPRRRREHAAPARLARGLRGRSSPRRIGPAVPRPAARSGEAPVATAAGRRARAARSATP